MKKQRLVWFNGTIVLDKEAMINVMSPTCQYGINVFESVRCYVNKQQNKLLAFRLDRHIERLLHSAKILRLNSIYGAEDIREAFIKTVQANGYTEDISVRIVLYIKNTGNWAYTGDCELLVAPIPMGRYIADNEGIHCSVSSWERINDRSISPRIKAGANYINSRMAQLEVLRNNYDMALILNKDGKISEAPGSCIFIVREGKLITPPITASILESITRETIIIIAREELRLAVEERDIDRTELYISDEIFLCGTAVEIVPVYSVDKINIGDGKTGKLTNIIKQKYIDIVRGELENYPGWKQIVRTL